jgi:peptide/nickel transport system ATP-binding protein
VNPLLNLKNLSVNFISESSVSNAIKNLSFSVERGEIMAVVGESGSGKTVTALSVLQLLPSPPAKYTSGVILFSENGNDSIDLLHLSKKQIQQIRGNKIGMIFQEPMSSLNPVFTCGRQVMEAILQHKNISKQKAKDQTMEWFGKVKLPDPEYIFHRYPHQLSGGQKQRVMIAIAMCCNPALLICDEPTTALDVTVQKTILELLKELQSEQNIGIIFITHDLGVVAEIADRAVVMYKGEIVEQNTIKEIFNRPQHPYTKGLLACRPVLHPRGERLPVVSDFMTSDEGGQMVETQQAINYTYEDIKNKEGGSKISIQFPQPAHFQNAQPVLIKVENLRVWFVSRKNLLSRHPTYTKAVDDVSFVVYKGETLGLVGESGCGKTTLGRALLRLVDPTGGKILYEGIDLTAKSMNELKPFRKKIQIVFQDPYSSLNPRLTIGSAISEPMKVHSILPNEKMRKEKVIELLEKVDMKPEHFSRYPHEFSGGQRQRIVIARALALNPYFIVCDESVSALDVSVQAQVLNLLNDLKREFGFTIIFISHDLSIVRYISDRIMVMNDGKIVETGEADEIYFNPQSGYTKKLISSIPKRMP